MALVGEAEAGLLRPPRGDLVVVKLAAPAVVADALELVGFAEVVLLLAVCALLELLEAVRKGTLIFVRTRIKLKPAVADFCLRRQVVAHAWSGKVNLQEIT